MFQKASEADFIRGEHEMLRFWQEGRIFQKLREQRRRENAERRAWGEPERIWSFLDGPITANNPMGVHHAWGRAYKDAYQRYFAMTGHELRYQNGFDCQGLWVEVEVERELGFTTKAEIEQFGIDRFVNECKKRVLRYAARQTEQSIRLGFWMEWDDPDALRKLSEAVGEETPVTVTVPTGQQVTDKAHNIVAKLGCPEWGGSYFTFSTENNETIWTFLKKCFRRRKIYRGTDVMPWSGRAGSAYSQMEVADGRRLSVHKAVFVRFPIKRAESGERRAESQNSQADASASDSSDPQPSTLNSQPSEYLLVWTTTPWTLTGNVACAVNPELEYVKLRSKRDGAIYYFAADNLDYQRLGREYKEGFGRPEWEWPQGVPKLKTIAQIFKEQGGYEVEGALKGADMIGWEYEGPFDDLPAQQTPCGIGDSLEAQPRTDNRGYSSAASGIDCHRVIDGGRDSKGNPNVVAGEGTGIVHIAPGCGDIDHELGKQHGLVDIAPLEEDGTFTEGFGEFTGKRAVDPGTAELVFDKLREKGLLVAVEDYPHVYPHCWRTGDELVFRLVDEWFINMDWRDEIKEVVKTIRWLPDEIQGQEREIEWLTNMRDWMISKKRFWGLALPVWVDDETGEFEVIGSLAELKDRAVEGWEEFEGNSPHRPWIDRVKIRNPKTGNLMSRIVDVGNPWLDAGIVPFSTMQYNTNHDYWEQWYPADFVTECFPGQFRNWFYALLAMATMMRYDEAAGPEQKRPFKTLLGHRLVMNEDGKPMHKSDGTAIWFEEAAEQLGVDTMRWMYLAQNPSVDLRFGTRHPDEPVTIETPAGPLDKTPEGEPICRVTSKPSDEVRRQVLIPLWNSYKFFVNYALLDEFDPTLIEVPVECRPEIDRWILSNMQDLVQRCCKEFESFNVAGVCLAASEFIDDLSNWYIRRNRRRFWRERSTHQMPEGADELNRIRDQLKRGFDTWLDQGWEEDKLAAYQTLYAVLVNLTKVLAPVIPFLAERMYQNLVARWDKGAPESVHLCEYPQPHESLLDLELNRRTALAQRVVRLIHRLRDEHNIRVRQPLSELIVESESNDDLEAIEDQSGVILDEVNVNSMLGVPNFEEYVRRICKPNLKTLGPKYGKLLNALKETLPTLPAEQLAALRTGEPVTLTVQGTEVVLLPEDVLFETETAAGWVYAEDRGLQVALNIAMTPELKREGMARDFVRHVQQLRKEADLEIEDRIRILYHTDDAELQHALSDWADYIKTETLADALTDSPKLAPDAKPVRVGGVKLPVGIERVDDVR